MRETEQNPLPEGTAGIFNAVTHAPEFTDGDQGRKHELVFHNGLRVMVEGASVQTFAVEAEATGHPLDIVGVWAAICCAAPLQKVSTEMLH